MYNTTVTPSRSEYCHKVYCWVPSNIPELVKHRYLNFAIYTCTILDVVRKDEPRKDSNGSMVMCTLKFDKIRNGVNMEIDRGVIVFNVLDVQKNEQGDVLDPFTKLLENLAEAVGISPIYVEVPAWVDLWEKGDVLRVAKATWIKIVDHWIKNDMPMPLLSRRDFRINSGEWPDCSALHSNP